ncbi:DUF4339 domain-containing protein [Martelella alba]|nr:DUF4339 domain-containing protein [Martelella alba]
MAGWWYIADNQRQGPVTLPTLEKLLHHRVLNAQSLIWREGFAQWMPVSAIHELKPLLDSPPPLLAPSPHQAVLPSFTLNASRRWIYSGLLIGLLIAVSSTVYFTQQGDFRQLLDDIKGSAMWRAATPSVRQTTLSPPAISAHQWRNPITHKRAIIDDTWSVKQLEAGPGMLTSSFISSDTHVNFSVVRDNGPSLNQVVAYLKAHEPTLRFINAGNYHNNKTLAEWTGIATSPTDHERHYIVHVTDAKAGYSIFIAMINQQTAASVARLEALMAQLDSTFLE